MSFSPDGKNIVSGSSLGANVWDVVGGGLIVCLTEGGSTSVTYSRDGKYTSSSRLVDGRVSVWVRNAVIHEIDPLGRTCVASHFYQMESVKRLVTIEIFEYGEMLRAV